MERPDAHLTALIDPAAPLSVWVETTWPGYQAQLEACEGFAALLDAQPEDGLRLLGGELDCRRYAYLRLRHHLLAPAARGRFGAQLRALEELAVELPGGAGTRIELSARAPYWALISTTMPAWQERLDGHPLAVRLLDDESEVRHYLLPRALVELRACRPRCSRPALNPQREKCTARSASGP